jgi:hypothetical protein
MERRSTHLHWTSRQELSAGFGERNFNSASSCMSYWRLFTDHPGFVRRNATTTTSWRKILPFSASKPRNFVTPALVILRTSLKQSGSIRSRATTASLTVRRIAGR